MTDPHLPNPHQSDPIDIERTFAALAALTPTPAQSTHTLATLRASLTKRKPTRWLWPISIAAAAALLLTTLLLFTTSPPASAADNLATTLAANQNYKGWVHMTGLSLPEIGKITRHWNTQTGMSALIFESKTETTISLRDPKARTFQEYRSSTGRIRLCELPADQADKLRQEATQTPLMFSDIIDGMRGILGEKAVTVTQSIDNGLDRFDIHIDEAAKLRLWDEHAPPRKRWFGADSDPTRIWVDHETKLIRTVRINGDDLIFTYGAPEITSIYDLGIPRDAKIYDTRLYHPAIETLTVLNRLNAKPLTDGISALLTEKDNKTLSFKLSARAGDAFHWRDYNKVILGDSGKPGFLAIPADWTGTGADAFLRRVIATIPQSEMYVTATSEIVGFTARMFDDSGRDRSGTSPPRARSPIFDGMSMGSPSYAVSIIPTLNSSHASGDQVQLASDNDHPGLLALHFEAHNDNPDAAYYDSWLWFDPRQNDRPITLILNYYKVSNSPPLQTLTSRTETQFSDFVTLPGPNPRTYPATALSTTFTAAPDGKLTVQSREKATFHFYPNQILPEVQIPTQPN